MAAVRDRVKETTTSTGTGNITLSGASTGYQTFNAAFGTNNEFYYCITDGTAWEVGEGYLTGSTTLVRDNVYASSNSNALVSFSAGSKDVFCTIPAYEFTTLGKQRAMATGLSNY